MATSPIARSATVLVLGAVAACGPATPAPSTPVPAQPAQVWSPPAPPVSVAAPSSSAPASPAPVAIESLAPIASPACQIDLASGRLLSSVNLQLLGHPLGAIDGPVESIRVQIGANATRAVARIVTDSLSLEAEVDPHSLRVGHKADAALIEGYIRLERAPLKDASSGRATVTFGLPDGVTAVKPTRQAEVPCSALTLYFASSPTFQGKSLELKTDAKSDLRVSPGSQPVARVSGPPHPASADDPRELRMVTVVAEKGPLTQIAYDGQEASVIGWVDSRLIEKRAKNLFGVLGALGGGSPSPTTVDLRCAASTPVLAELDGKIYRVGEVRAGGTVHSRPRASGGHALVIEPVDFFFGGPGLSTPASSAPKRPVEVYLPVDASSCTPVPKSK